MESLNIEKGLMKRNASYSNMEASTEANVLVIYTGGTIGMARNSSNGMFNFNSLSFHW